MPRHQEGALSRMCAQLGRELGDVIYLGDGGTSCPGHDPAAYARQTLSEVSNANYKKHQINSICVGSDDVNEDFCKQLAAAHHGTYRRVSRP